MMINCDIISSIQVTVDLLLQPHFYKIKEKKCVKSNESKPAEGPSPSGDTPATSTTTTPEASTATGATAATSATSATATSTTAAGAEAGAGATGQDNTPSTSSATASSATASASSVTAPSSSSSSVTTSASATQQGPGTFQIRLVRETYMPGSLGHPASQGTTTNSMGMDGSKALKYTCTVNLRV